MQGVAETVMDKPDSVYIVFIAARPAQVWDLLNDSGASPDWFFGNRMVVGAAPGDPFQVFRPDGATDVEGTILEKVPEQRLRVSWVMPDMPIRPGDDQVEFLIEEKAEGVVRLAVQEYHSAPLPQKWIESGREGWSLILSSLKTMLETGKPLPRVEMRPPE